MYDYISNKDKGFLSKMRSICSDLVNQLVQHINNDNTLYVEANLVGSGAKHLETQNNEEPVDLDYNLVILDTNGLEITNCREVKEYVRKAFNEVLSKNGWGDCKDSTSALTTEKRHFKKGNRTEFSIDLAIIFEGKNNWYRLIHEKTGSTNHDRYYWNEGPDSKNLVKRVQWIKDAGLWTIVRDTYLDKKECVSKKK